MKLYETINLFLDPPLVFYMIWKDSHIYKQKKVQNFIQQQERKYMYNTNTAARQFFQINSPH